MKSRLYLKGDEKMMNYYFGQQPKVGDTVSFVDQDERYDLTDKVSSINEDGTINVDNGMGILHDLDPSNYILTSSEWSSFWKAMSLSKEDDVLECEDYYGNIVNNGDYTFMW